MIVDNETTIAYIGLGSNLGDRAGNLLLATRGLMEAGLTVNRLSAIYETEPVGVPNHDFYLNMVAEVRTTHITPSQLLARMIRVEYLLGRRHKFLQAPRTVDLDLLFYGDLHVESEFLRVPHRRVHQRKFVLVPMAELCPHFIHPAQDKSIETLLNEVDDQTKVRRWHPNEKIRKQKTRISGEDQTLSKNSPSTKG